MPRGKPLRVNWESVATERSEKIIELGQELESIKADLLLESQKSENRGKERELWSKQAHEYAQKHIESERRVAELTGERDALAVRVGKLTEANELFKRMNGRVVQRFDEMKADKLNADKALADYVQSFHANRGILEKLLLALTRAKIKVPHFSEHYVRFDADTWQEILGYIDQLQQPQKDGDVFVARCPTCNKDGPRNPKVWARLCPDEWHYPAPARETETSKATSGACKPCN